MDNRQILEALSRELIDNIGNKLTEALINGILMKYNRILPPPEIALPPDAEIKQL